MIVKTCDTCGDEVGKLHTLIDDYKSDNIVDVCDKCLKEINSTLYKISKAQRI